MTDNSNKRYKIVYHKNECIGAFACVAAEPETWEIAEDDTTKADIVNHDEKKGETYVKYVDDLKNNMEAAQSCPVNCIHIIDQETGEELI